MRFLDNLACMAGKITERAKQPEVLINMHLFITHYKKGSREVHADTTCGNASTRLLFSLTFYKYTKGNKKGDIYISAHITITTMINFSATRWE